MNIREVNLDDTEQFVQLIKEVENQSEFMLYGAGERNITIEGQRKQLDLIVRSSHSTILVAEETSGYLVGYLFAIGNNAIRKKHSAYLVIGILKEYTGKGIGTKLFQSLEDWVATNHIQRLELTVVTENKAGIALYKKMGFEIDGTKRNSIIIDGNSFDEYHMAKLFIGEKNKDVDFLWTDMKNY
ncbi:GNAT family N-acetyltransferase [Bacillus sp. AFS017336]|uniref:GNAT family N-acetyltransferase n=1 Tax=Bacillus sp. AFS017336 TaxID=2033489 RepID=UPI000BF0966E|nr:GNAT family N-acetyltransferase [Bacillus sp. AFS017336]PEK97866.1 GNAT family N-acetyltransferase [Bacillus sp. AFS017336]